VPGIESLQVHTTSAADPDRTPRPIAGAPAERSLRILFVVQEGELQRFALLIPALAERGHTIHVAFASGHDWDGLSRAPKPPPPKSVVLVEELCARFPQITHGLAPQRSDSDGWRRVAWLVRALADLAHNAHPRYAGSHPRLRTKKRILKQMRRRSEFEPLGRRLVLRLARRVSSKTDAELSHSVLRLATRLEEAIPTSSDVDAYIRRQAPDIVVATGTFRHVSSEVEYLKSARRLGIPSGVFVASWDNLVNKGSMKFTPERVFVWNEIQVRDAVELHGLPRDRVRATGAHDFDDWFERRPSLSREQYLARLGLDPARPYLVYLCSSSMVVGPHGEADFVKRWIGAVRSSSDDRLRTINVVVRPHPSSNGDWDAVDLGFDNAVVWPRHGIRPVTEAARAEFFDTLSHSAAVVGLNTTAMIEAAILGKSVMSVLTTEFNQGSTLHFHYLLAENGGFLHVAKSLEEHVEQLRQVLDEDAVGAERRRRFVQSFVRPAGLDRPAAPIAAAAIEELAGVRVEARDRLGTRALRLLLALEAALTVAYRSYRLRRRGRRRSLKLEPRETPG
jgi:hypothetical protein